MKTTLHILRNEPDDILAALIDLISEDEGVRVIGLYADGITGSPVDWDRLVKDVFAHERVICWW